jgi:hypothetical protein
VIVHDLIAWPIYTAADSALIRAQRRHAGDRVGSELGSGGPDNPHGRASPAVPWVNHIRFPSVISGVLLAMFFPLILRISGSAYLASTGLTENVYLLNWLVVTGALFATSAFIYVLRLWLARRRAQRGRRAAPSALTRD